jgi:hypothetical protein
VEVWAGIPYRHVARHARVIVAAVRGAGRVLHLCGHGVVGAHAAVLNTARLSGLVFAVTPAARGFAAATTGWRRWLGDQRVVLQGALRDAC